MTELGYLVPGVIKLVVNEVIAQVTNHKLSIFNT